MDKSKEIIVLNVGGEKITTRKSTLKRKRDSMLGAMFSDTNSGMLDILPDDSVFIDANPVAFKAIIDILRRNLDFDPDCPPEGVSAKVWRAELRYFQLTDIAEEPPVDKLQKLVTEGQELHDKFVKDVLTVFIEHMKKSHTFLELLKNGFATFHMIEDSPVCAYNEDVQKEVHANMFHWIKSDSVQYAIKQAINASKIFVSTVTPKATRASDRSKLLYGWPAAPCQSAPREIQIDRDTYLYMEVTLNMKIYDV